MELSQYFGVLRRRWLLLVVIVLACVVAAGAIAWTRPATYTAQTQLFVSTTAAPGDVSQTYEGGLFAQQRVVSYATIVSSPGVVQKVITELGLRKSIMQIQGEIHASVPVGTVLVDITINDRSAQTAKALADAVAAQFTSFVEALETPRVGQPPLVKVSVTSPARLPTSPSSPRKSLYLAAGLLLGLVLGIGAAVLRDSLDIRIRNVGDATTVVSAPLIGTVLDDGRARSRPLVVLDEPHSLDAEAYRRTRTNLQVLLRDRGARAFVIASPASSEGKTLVAANLGVAFAQAGHRVAMVNADLRRPQLGHVLSASSTRGLTDVLKGDVPLDSVLLKHPSLPLELLDSGPLPPDPTETLESERFLEIIQALTRRADIVIVDAPALLAVTDAAIVAQAVAGAILVARIGSTRTAELRAAAQSLAMVGVPVLGLILNRGSRREARRYGPDPAAFEALRPARAE